MNEFFLPEKLNEIVKKNRECPEIGFFGPNSHLWNNHKYAIRALCYPLAVIIINANQNIFNVITSYLSDPNELVKHGLARQKYSFNFIFGDLTTACNAAKTLHDIHAKLAIKDKEQIINANNPELMLWVWATIYYSSKKINELFLKEISFNEETYAEYKLLALLSGVDEKIIPKTMEDFDKYFINSLNSTIKVSKKTKDYINEMFDIPILEFILQKNPNKLLRILSNPINKLVKQFCIFVLPLSLTKAYDLYLTKNEQTKINRTIKLIAFIHPLLPKRITIKSKVLELYNSLKIITQD